MINLYEKGIQPLPDENHLKHEGESFIHSSHFKERKKIPYLHKKRIV